VTDAFQAPQPRRRGRRLRVKADGRLFDLDERRPVSLRELRDDVRSGRSFRAFRQRTGTECTNEVLVEVLRTGLPRHVERTVADGLSALLSLWAKEAGEESRDAEGERGRS
jgi:hypothetical protein